jgi:hypothetical protein
MEIDPVKMEKCIAYRTVSMFVLCVFCEHSLIESLPSHVDLVTATS